MQSILQYRRFGRHVRAQYERDRDKAEAIGERKENGLWEPTSPCSSRTDAGRGDNNEDDGRDPEKGEYAPAQGKKEGEGMPVSAEHAFESRQSAGPLSPKNTRNSMATASQVVTQGSMGTNLGTALTGINVRDRTTKEGPSDPTVNGNKVFVVGYEGEHDSLNPHNWSYGTRIWATVNIAFIGWIVGFASSVDSAALVQASEDFGVSEVVESLATGLFLVGFGTGGYMMRKLLRTLLTYDQQVRFSQGLSRRPWVAIQSTLRPCRST